MKRILLISFCIALLNYVYAQPEFTAEASQLLTSFKFKNSAGVKENSEYQSLITGAYGIGLRYLTAGGFVFKAGVNLRNGGANLVYDDVNYDWKLQYLDLKGGIGYMVQFKNVKPYLNVLGYYANLLRGVQTLHDERLNIKKSNVLKNNDYGIQVNPGINIKINQFMSTYVEFQYVLGLTNLEVSGSQESKNTAYGLTLGLSFLLVDKKQYQ